MAATHASCAKAFSAVMALKLPTSNCSAAKRYSTKNARSGPKSAPSAPKTPVKPWKKLKRRQATKPAAQPNPRPAKAKSPDQYNPNYHGAAADGSGPFSCRGVQGISPGGSSTFGI